jgi:hypothetical protein
MENGEPNGVFPRRIEEKMGLHGSPTCAMGFEGAKGYLLGTLGRGLPQLFSMIVFMRLSVGVQGLGIAAGAAETALTYAGERRQGGQPSAPPVTIDCHADVQRLLLEAVSSVEVFRGLVYTAAIQADLSACETDPQAAAQAAALTQWLLPIVKTLGGETAVAAAHNAIQVLGGAGYVREWGVEQALRDGRIFTIYEGTTGMQALDLVHRRLWKDEGAGLRRFLDLARVDLQDASEVGAPLAAVLDLLEQAAGRLTGWQDHPREAEAGATAFLTLAGLAATGWVALRLAELDPAEPRSGRLRAAGRYWLSVLQPRAAAAYAGVIAGAAPLAYFSALQAQ